MAVVTISRQIGSGGNEIATRLCELLKYRYFDKRVIIQAASEAGLSESEVVDYSEENYKVRGFLESLFRPGPRVVSQVSIRARGTEGVETLSTQQLDEARCVDLVRSAVRTAYKHGNVVIVGRGGQAILQDEPGVLHVRVEAPMGTRIRRLQEREGLSAEEAERRAVQADRATAQYLGRFFGIRWDDSMLYHLVINTGKLEPEAASQLIADAVRRLEATPSA